MFFDCKEAFEQIEIKYQQQLILSIYPPHDSSAFAASNPASSRRPCNRQEEKKLIKHINITPSTGQRLHNGAPPPLSLSLYRQPSTTTPHQSYLSNRIPSHHLTSSHYARQPAVGWLLAAASKGVSFQSNPWCNLRASETPSRRDVCHASCVSQQRQPWRFHRRASCARGCLFGRRGEGSATG